MRSHIQILIVVVSILNGILLDAVVPQWDWNTIPINTLTLPPIKGTSISEYQVSGKNNCPYSNWADWENRKEWNGKPTIHDNDWSGSACDFWNRWSTDIQLIKDLGCNSFRLSVEWSNIEPREGEFCKEAIDHYVQLCTQLRQMGIEPMITLHHFTHPQWFEHKGGFANEANIDYFVRFCRYVFTHLSSQVKLWCTINEIGPFAFQGYIQGVFPPGKRFDLYAACTVMRTMILAHCAVYDALKQLPGGKDAQIGLVHQYLTVEPYTTSYITPALEGLGLSALLTSAWYLYGHAATNVTSAKLGYASAASTLISNALNPIERIPACSMTYFFNDVFLSFFKTGELFSWIPRLHTRIPNAHNKYDFIGLNFYSRVVIESRMWHWLLSGCRGGLGKIATPSCRQGEIMTDMEYGICPEGLYEAIKVMAQFKKPIYITENGIADRHDDRRSLWIRRYLYAVSKAIQDGYDVRGYYHWSLMDNFEWDRGYAQRFGLYQVDFETKERSLKQSAHIIRDIFYAAAAGHQ